MYFIISILVLLISYWLFKQASGSMHIQKINMISLIFYYYLVLQSFIGVNLALFYLDNHYVIGRLQGFDIRQHAYFAVCYVMIVLPLSMVVVNKIFCFNPARSLAIYGYKPIKPITSLQNAYEPIVFIILSIIAVLSVLYTYANMHSLPFVLFLKGIVTESAQARIEVSRNFAGNQYIKNIFGLSLTPLLAYIAYGYKKLSNRRLYNYLFYILLFSSILILTYNAAKAPVLWFLLGFLFLKVLLEGKISKRLLFISTITICVIIIFFYGLMGQHELIKYNSGPIGRIILGQIAGLFYMLYLFPDIYPFMGLQAFPQFLLNLLDVPLEHMRPARLVMMYVNPSGVEQGTAGVVNTLFVGEAWAMYGVIGLLVAPLLVGFIVQLFYVLILKMPKNPLALGLYTYLCLSWPITGGFVDFIYNVGLLTIITICIVWYLVVDLPWRSRLGDKRS